MARKRRTKDFNVPGKVRYSECNPRRKDADWLQFACAVSETDTIMAAIGKATQSIPLADEMPAGTILAKICKTYIEEPRQ